MATTEGGLSVEVLRSHDHVVVQLAGELTGAEADGLVSAVTAALAEQPRNLQLVMPGVTFIDSGGLAALYLIYTEATERSIPMRLLAVPDRVRRVLVISGMDQHFTLVD